VPALVEVLLVLLAEEVLLDAEEVSASAVDVLPVEAVLEADDDDVPESKVCSNCRRLLESPLLEW
jgi:hypothetical protein